MKGGIRLRCYSVYDRSEQDTWGYLFYKNTETLGLGTATVFRWFTVGEISLSTFGVNLFLTIRTNLLFMTGLILALSFGLLLAGLLCLRAVEHWRLHY
jgi:hypothetical protein